MMRFILVSYFGWTKKKSQIELNEHELNIYVCVCVNILQLNVQKTWNVKKLKLLNTPNKYILTNR